MPYTPFKPFQYSSGPWPYIYIPYTISKLLLIQIPLHFLLYLNPSARPRRSWSLSQNLGAYVKTVGVKMVFQVGGFDMMSTDPQKKPKNAEKLGWVPVPPVPTDKLSPELIELAEKNDVAVDYAVSGCWNGERGADGLAGQKAAEGEKVILHMHGGGYVMGASYGVLASPVANRLLQLDPVRFKRVFTLEYRLSRAIPWTPANAWPAALIDAISSWTYLLSLGFLPENIVVAGDSAGGHLAFCLTHYLAHHPTFDLGKPRALLLLSPAMDCTPSNIGPESSCERNRPIDGAVAVLDSQWCTDALRGKAMTREDWSSDPLCSPGSLNSHPPKGFYEGMPKTLIHSGDAEIGLDAIRIFKDRMQAELGDQVEYIETVDMVHVGLMAASGKELATLIEQYREWLRRC